MKALRELGICFDENGRLHYVKNNEIITMFYLTVYPLLTVDSITQFVLYALETLSNRFK